MKRTVTGLSLIVAALFGVVAAVRAPATAADNTLNLTLKLPHRPLHCDLELVSGRDERNPAVQRAYQWRWAHPGHYRPARYGGHGLHWHHAAPRQGAVRH